MNRLWQWYLGPKEKRMSDEERKAWRPMAIALMAQGGLYIVGGSALLIWHYWL